MADIKDGGPAFPYSALEPDEKTRQLVGSMYADNQGMSLRDWFAGQALQGMLSDSVTIQWLKDLSDTSDVSAGEWIAQFVYAQADAMLKARGGSVMAKRYCGMCDEWVNGKECPKCGADTDKAAK